MKHTTTAYLLATYLALGLANTSFDEQGTANYINPLMLRVQKKKSINFTLD